MMAMDIGHTSPAVTIHPIELAEQVRRTPSSMLEDWGKGVSFTLSSIKGTQPSVPNRFVLLVDDQPVTFTLTSDRHTSTLKDVATVQSVALAQRLDSIKDRLALSVTQMSELFGVTRKSIYDWYEGKGQRSATALRMEILIDALSSPPPEVDLRRLKAVWNIAVSGESFRDVFGNDKLDTAALLAALIEKLHELSPRMVATTAPLRQTAPQIGEAHLAEFDRRADFE